MTACSRRESVLLSQVASTSPTYLSYVSLREREGEREREREGGGGGVCFLLLLFTVVSCRHPPDQLLCLQSRFQEDIPGNQVPCRAGEQVSDATPLTPQTGWHPHALVNAFPTRVKILDRPNWSLDRLTVS